MSKINFDLLEKGYKKDFGAKKIVELTVAGEKQEVRVKQSIGKNDLQKIVDELTDLEQFNDKREKDGLIDEVEREKLFFSSWTLATFKVLTDIEFPSSIEDQYKMIYILQHYGFNETILNSVPQKVLNELKKFLEDFAEGMEQLIKELEKSDKGE